MAFKLQSDFMKYYIFLCLFFLFSCQQSDNSYDLIISNALLFDGINFTNTEQCIIIKGNKIERVIPQSEIDLDQYNSHNIIDAKGQFVMPGLIEGHGHLLAYGEGLSQLELGQYNNWDEIIEAVAKKANELPDGQWIEGRGWHQEKWNKQVDNAVQGYPHHQKLSRLVPDHPVYLIHASGHAAFANQKAMEAVGITTETNAAAGGRILKDVEGNLAGIFEENAMEIISDFVEQTKDLESIWEDALINASSDCLKFGITSFQDAGLNIEQIKWLKEKAKNKKLPIRLFVMAYDSLQNLQKSFPQYRLINASDSFLTCRAAKAYFDGALGSRGAWLLEDYEDQPGYYGQNTMTVSELQQYASLCQQENLQFCVHAIGDRANRETLNLFEKNTRKNPDHRWRVEHAQHIDLMDQPRFQQLGVIASMQPIHCTSDAPFVTIRLGQERAKNGAYVWRNLLNSKAKLAIGTDVPVESMNPFENMYAAVSRKARSREGVFFADQVMTREEILKAYTSENAYAAFEESFKGKIEPGFLADLCILDRNLMTCSADEIAATQVNYTILNGKVVFIHKIK